MAKLIYSLDGAFLGEFPLEKDRLTIGRRPSNDIHIDNLAISGEHATVSKSGGDVVLEDLESTNGTVVNGKAIKKHVMQHGDVIELGKYQLKFVNEAFLQDKLGTATAVDYEKTMIIRPGSLHAAPPVPAAPVAEVPAEELTSPPVEAPPAVEQAPAVLPSWARPPSAAAAPAPNATTPAQLPVAHIQVLNGPSTGKELPLIKALTTLGKPGVQVAVLTRRPHGYFVTHVEGDRHPVVNGQSVGAQAHQLNDHDIIEIAGVKMEFYFVGG